MTNPLLTETPIVSINGEQKHLPRLTFSATLSILNLLRNTLSPELVQSVTALQGSELSDFERGFSIISTILETVDDSEEKLYDLVSKVLKIEKEAAEELPLEELVEIVIAFKDHPDISFFTKHLPTAVKNLLKEQTQSLAKSMTN